MRAEQCGGDDGWDLFCDEEKEATGAENPRIRTFGEGSVEASPLGRCVCIEVTSQRGMDVEPDSGTAWEMCWGWGVCGDKVP